MTDPTRRTVTPPPATLVTVRLSDARRARLEALAEARGVRPSEVLRALIDEAFDRMESDRRR
ncbi:MAG: hypothetical protein ACSLFM_04490 [Tepidiformaceae bacterium]